MEQIRLTCLSRELKTDKKKNTQTHKQKTTGSARIRGSVAVPPEESWRDESPDTATVGTLKGCRVSKERKLALYKKKLCICYNHHHQGLSVTSKKSPHCAIAT